MTAKVDSTPTRTCKGCKQELPATMDYFPPNKMGKYGLHTHCRPCKKQRDAELRARPDQQARQKAWRDANKDRIKQYNEEYRAAGYRSTDHVRAWYHANLEHARAYNREKMRELREADPEKYRAAQKRHYYANRELVLERVRQQSARKYREDVAFNLRAKIGPRLRSMLRGVGGKAQRRTEELLGFTLDELKHHLERQFTKGMTWEKLLAGEIHIDHIQPVWSFNVTSVDCPEFRACWALSNLQPLWAHDNLCKQGRIVKLL